jgi:16S rRNA (guanine527-N7)-methyltransferase
LKKEYDHSHDVSRETSPKNKINGAKEMNKIDAYINLLKEYNEHTNIYSKKAYDKLDFHVQDSMEIARLIKNTDQVVMDMGSGSGLPSIIIAIQNPNNKVIAVESKSRKSNFLKECKEKLDLKNYTVINDNITEYLHKEKPKANVITAKAFAPFEKCYKLALRMSKRGTRLIVPISGKQQEENTPEWGNKVAFIKNESLETYYQIKTF